MPLHVTEQVRAIKAYRRKLKRSKGLRINNDGACQDWVKSGKAKYWREHLHK